MIIDQCNNKFAGNILCNTLQENTISLERNDLYSNFKSKMSAAFFIYLLLGGLL